MSPAQGVVPQISQIDSDRYGIPIARASGLAASNIPGVVDWCRRNGVRLLMARTPEIEAVQAMESEGFFLTDVLVYYQFPFEKRQIPLGSDDIVVRPYREAEVDEIVEIARLSFSGFGGHYHSDPRLDNEKCVEGYADWARNSCTEKRYADEVFVAEQDGRLAGFATVLVREPGVAQGMLVAVRPEAQRGGLYRELTIARMHWCADHGLRQMIGSTHIRNFPIQKVLQRLGFETLEVEFTLHKWYD